MSLALTTTHENGIFRGVSGRFLALQQPLDTPACPPLWKISVQQAYFSLQGRSQTPSRGGAWPHTSRCPWA